MTLTCCHCIAVHGNTDIDCSCGYNFVVFFIVGFVLAHDGDLTCKQAGISTTCKVCRPQVSFHADIVMYVYFVIHCMKKTMRQKPYLYDRKLLLYS